ncbi:YciI family protein [Chryseobacterium sp. MFBS3-17]|uniref:YciI family protein n=1 Tax=Chryseobacterium sp. MFBS3-17 TaxID=2886689 RepID=UPI001D0ED7CD|nr:YciI family protein [Chryseobacterium sp. MFBS3-17]MCC2589473.1 YciI family protein [Chryseobacterium sp. MFBS3-17]
MKTPIFLTALFFVLNSCAIHQSGKNGAPGAPGAEGVRTLPETKTSGYNQALADSLGADEYGMKTYVMVILKTGPSVITDKEELNRHFRGHMENIQRLAKEGKLIVAGPFATKNDLGYRGIFILDVKTAEEAERLINTDPAVQAGIFGYEILPWYGSAALPLYLKHTEAITRQQP